MMHIKNQLLEHFDDVVDYAGKGVDFLIKNHDSFGYGEFGDHGNSCYKPYKDSVRQLCITNEMIGAVRQAMPKFSDRHIKLSLAVAGDLSLKWVSYDWLCKATARILADESQNIEDLECMANVSRKMRNLGHF